MVDPIEKKDIAAEENSSCATGSAADASFPAADNSAAQEAGMAAGAEDATGLKETETLHSGETAADSQDTVTVKDAAETAYTQETVIASNANEAADLKETETVPDAEQGPVYTWSFEEQLKADREAEKKKSRKGTLIYAVIMTCLFAVCFGTLAVLIVTGFGGAGHTPAIPGEQMTIPQIAEALIPTTVGVSVTTEKGGGVGTGIIMSEDGYIVTNYHVISGAKTVKTVLSDQTVLDAEIVGGDELSDLALLKIDPKGLRLSAALFGDSDKAVIGEEVVAIGNPAGLEFAGTVTSGIISAINRNVRIYSSNGLLNKTMTLIQTSANLNPGNSGGPLINMRGEVIGINTMRLSAEYEGIGFAIPVNGALKILEEIRRTGSYSGEDVAVKGVSLGVTATAVVEGNTYPLTRDDEKWTAGKTGVAITQIMSGESSAYGKLEVYDIIMSIDGVAVGDVYDVREILLNHRSGDVISILIWRDGDEKTVSVTLK